MEVRRPEHFFDPKGTMPVTASLELTLPPGFDSVEAFRGQVGAALTHREDEAVREHRGRFLGVARVLAQRPTAPGEPRRALNPRIAARDKWKRIEALGRLVEFLRAYRAAWAARSAGKSDVVFF